MNRGNQQTRSPRNPVRLKNPGPAKSLAQSNTGADHAALTSEGAGCAAALSAFTRGGVGRFPVRKHPETAPSPRISPPRHEPPTPPPAPPPPKTPPPPPGTPHPPRWGPRPQGLAGPLTSGRPGPPQGQNAETGPSPRHGLPGRAGLPDP